MEKTINFRISEENKLELQFIAEEREIRLSHLVREIISEFIENYYSDNVYTITMHSQIPKKITLYVPNNDDSNQ